MGVVYKLTQEIIDFIVRYKRENSHVSCRSLVAIVNEKFSLQVSKSSINAVLKKSNLSSSVGRRSRPDKKITKFHIPEERKQHLFSSIPSIDVNGPFSEDSPRNQVRSEKEIKEQKNEEMSNLDRMDIDKAILDGMGVFFLKAAQWEITQSPFLSLLADRLKTQDSSKIKSLGNLLLFSRLFGIKSISEIEKYKKEGLWKIADFSKSFGVGRFERDITELFRAKETISEIDALYAHLFSEADYFKLILEDGSSLVVDGRVKTLWQEDKISSYFSIPLQKASFCLSRFFVVNSEPLIIQHIPGKEQWSGFFYDFVGAFQNIQGKRIVEIGIYDSGHTEIAGVSSLPAKMRSFIIGAWPWQRQTRNLAEKAVYYEERLVLENMPEEMILSEVEFSLHGIEDHGLQTIGQNSSGQGSVLKPDSLGFAGVNSWSPQMTFKGFSEESGLRGIVLRDKNKCPILTIITNIPKIEMSNQEIVKNYCKKFPYFQKGYEDFLARVENPEISSSLIAPSSHQGENALGERNFDIIIEKNYDFQRILDFWLEALHQYSLRHFFPFSFRNMRFSTAQKEIYGLEGYYDETEEIISVTLQAPLGYPQSDSLAYAVRGINESDIRSPSHKRLVMKILTR